MLAVQLYGCKTAWILLNGNCPNFVVDCCQNLFFRKAPADALNNNLAYHSFNYIITGYSVCKLTSLILNSLLAIFTLLLTSPTRLDYSQYYKFINYERKIKCPVLKWSNKGIYVINNGRLPRMTKNKLQPS